jgi:hypothetical protein
MIFKENNTIIYCKDNSYQKKFDIDELLMTKGVIYYKGYLVNRNNGPAIIWDKGFKVWILDGKEYDKEEYWKIINCFKKNLKNKKKVLHGI